MIFSKLGGLKEESEVQLDLECVIYLRNKYEEFQKYRVWRMENALKFNFREMME
jgi:hypothetical protein